MKALIFSVLILSFAAQASEQQPTPNNCQPEAQISLSEILSVEYIPNIGCRARMSLHRYLPSQVCAPSEFDYDYITRVGVIVSPPSDQGCTFQPGDKTDGVIIKRNSIFYMSHVIDAMRN